MTRTNCSDGLKSLHSQLRYKRLESGAFKWPRITDGVMRRRRRNWPRLWMGWIGRGCMRATLRDRWRRRESCDFLNQIRFESNATEREFDLIMVMPIDAFSDDLDSLRELASQLSSERDAALAECKRVTEQNDRLRHLLQQLRRAQFGRKSDVLTLNSCNWQLRISRRRWRRRLPNKTRRRQ